MLSRMLSRLCSCSARDRRNSRRDRRESMSAGARHALRSQKRVALKWSRLWPCRDWSHASNDISLAHRRPWYCPPERPTAVGGWHLCDYFNLEPPAPTDRPSSLSHPQSHFPWELHAGWESYLASRKKVFSASPTQTTDRSSFIVTRKVIAALRSEPTKSTATSSTRPTLKHFTGTQRSNLLYPIAPTPHATSVPVLKHPEAT